MIWTLVGPYDSRVSSRLLRPRRTAHPRFRPRTHALLENRSQPVWAGAVALRPERQVYDGGSNWVPRASALSRRAPETLRCLDFEVIFVKSSEV